MLLIVDLDTQNIVDDPGISGARSDISIPRASSVELSVQFARGGVVVDPELGDTDIETSTSGSFTVSAISNEADATCTSVAAHGLSHGDSVQITSTAGIPTGLALLTTYYVRVVNSTSFKLATTYADAIANTNLIDTSSAGTAPHVFTPSVVFRAPGHSFIAGDTISIADHTGLPIRISGSAVSATAATITTLTDHGMTTGGNGTGADGRALAAGKFLVEISGHQTAQELRGAVTSSSATNPAIITTTLAHGLTNGDLVTVTGSTQAAVNVTAVAIVKSATTFALTGIDATAGAGTLGAFLRPASDINGTHVATWVSSTTFTIPIDNYSPLRGGTVTVTTTTPIANTAEGVTRTITAVTANTFTVGALTLTAAGAGGRASKTTTLNLRWTVKEDGKYDGDVLASSNNFVKSGSGSTTIFSGTCNYITSELNTLLAVDGIDTNDEERATLMAEFSWQGSKPSKTNWIRHYVRNDLYKTGEGDPVGVNGQDGRTTIGSLVSSINVTFSPTLASANWHFLGAPSIWNTGASALGISFMGLTAKSATGFTAFFSGTTDAVATYYMDWSVRMD